LQIEPLQHVVVTTAFHTKGTFCNKCDTIPPHDITVTLLSLCTPWWHVKQWSSISTHS